MLCVPLSRRMQTNRLVRMLPLKPVRRTKYAHRLSPSLDRLLLKPRTHLLLYHLLVLLRTHLSRLEHPHKVR